MTASLAPADPTVREFDAVVAAVDGRDVWLEETYFYAESGGQPADRGTLDGVVVDTVATTDDGVVHRLADPPSFEPGDTVVAVVDDDFRTYCSRAHTASHVLYGAGRHLLDDLGYGGFGIGEEKVRVDFTTTTEIDDETLVELERLANRAVWDSRPVSWREVPVTEARDSDRVSFNTKTEEGVMADADTVRIVTIEGWDWAACGGTHVSNTAEIGPITVLSRSNPGEGMTRVEFAVGPAGIDHRATVHANARAAAGTVDGNLESLPAETAGLDDRVAELEAELAETRAELLDARLADLPTTTRDGTTWRVGQLPDADPNDVGERAQERVDDDGGVVAVVGDGPAPFVVVATDGEVHAGGVVDDLTGTFGGGGGGGPTFAQGGGLDADADRVLAWLRRE
ncbi:DHHA1 domain-containing protein [Halobaculum sp. MBLA0143]|uniref:alanine--tRNA ligase-related protein n=1 Tax=Halobaculum sp. MBLA0143 TaxID=3079933 RepID=UPI00352450C6